jgi:hypothetical protein
LYAYDLVLLIPMLMLLWDWVLGQPERQVGDVWPLPTAHWPLYRKSFNRLFVMLLYACYFSPLFTKASELVHVQMSVLLHSLLLVVLAAVLHARTSV